LAEKGDEDVRKYSNARSIKTRIETIPSDCIHTYNIIRMQDPLKQGLKLTGRIKEFGGMLHSNARSIKTRIETIPSDCIHTYNIRIRMQDPLKQGLKLYRLRARGNHARHSNARSIKTRIETPIVRAGAD